MKANKMVVMASALVCAVAANAKLLPVEVFEKGSGDVDCASRYLIRERVRGCRASSATTSSSRVS